MVSLENAYYFLSTIKKEILKNIINCDNIPQKQTPCFEFSQIVNKFLAKGKMVLNHFTLGLNHT